MLFELFNSIVNSVTIFINDLGYMGIFFLMTLESAMIPIPSEIIMPFSGFLVSEGKMSFISVVLAGSIGNLIGSIITYYLGLKVGRSLIIKYGKYVLFNENHLKYTDKLFEKFGDKISFAGRLLPGIRTYVSFPIGIAKSNLVKFLIYTFFGSLIWNIILTYIGFRLGSSWQNIHSYSIYLDVIAAIVVTIAIIMFTYKMKKIRNEKRNTKNKL